MTIKEVKAKRLRVRRTAYEYRGNTIVVFYYGEPIELPQEIKDDIDKHFECCAIVRASPKVELYDVFPKSQFRRSEAWDISAIPINLHIGDFISDLNRSFKQHTENYWCYRIEI